MAIAGLAVAQDHGLTLPDQLSIVGYDDSELAAHVHPSLTSVRSDAVGWGRTATRVLLDSLDGPQTDVELAPASLVVRASTAGPPIPSQQEGPMRRTAISLSLLFVLAVAGCGGGGSEDADKAAAAKGPIKIWYSNNKEEVAWGKAAVAKWNAANPKETGHRAGDPRRQDLRGGHRRLDHGRQRAVPDLQHLARRGAAVPEAGRARRARHPPGRQGVRRGAQRRRSRRSTSPRTASTTSCPGSRTR